MSVNTPTAPSPPQRYLKSPFNGEAWPVPPELTPAMYEALLERGFEEIPAPKLRKEKP